eukprot:3676793-Lingulodinium_polyedra.AAC.1
MLLAFTQARVLVTSRAHKSVEIIDAASGAVVSAKLPCTQPGAQCPRKTPTWIACLTSGMC